MWTTLAVILNFGLLPPVIASDSLDSRYNDVTVVEDHFLAVGTGGRIDIIPRSGKPAPVRSNTEHDLNSVLYYRGRMVVAGDQGTVLFSETGRSFTRCDTNTRENINSIAAFQHTLIAGADHGKILICEEDSLWQEIQLPVKGNVVSVSAGASSCFGVTDKGEILSSADALNWSVFDYNAYYKGYAKPCIFTKVLVAKDWIAIAGRHEDHTPLVLFSQQGNVWQERSMNFTDEDGRPQVFRSIPNDIAYDSKRDQYFIACDEGVLSILSSCSKCNEAHKLSEKNLLAVACAADLLMIVGDELFIQAIPLLQ